MTSQNVLSVVAIPKLRETVIGVRAPPDLGEGGGGGGDVLARKNYAMPERVGVETGMQTETFIIFSSNETAIVGKIAQLKVCILNSINSLNVTLKNVLKEKALRFLPIGKLKSVIHA